LSDVSPPTEAWCAAHLDMLCSHAMKADDKFGVSPSGRRRGFLLPYESLPGGLAKIIFPMFGIKTADPIWVKNMKETSVQYSKGRGDRGATFKGDSEKKTKNAWPELKQYSDMIMMPSYIEMKKRSINALEDLMNSNIIEDVQQKKFQDLILSPKLSGSSEVDLPWGEFKSLD
jgi:hypothetical protein